MSGHSKWSKVKHQKATTDVVKGRAFTKASHAIAIAVHEGGNADPDLNFRLRLAIEKARAVNMPKENIERAITRASGGGAQQLQNITYEAYGPGGVGLLIETTTDNKQRTVSLIKNILDRFGGTLTSPGAVKYQFVRSGIITVPKADYSSEKMLELAIESGASDVVETEDMYEIYTDIPTLLSVKQQLDAKNVTIDNTQIVERPVTVLQVHDDMAQKIEQLTELLEELDDVQSVFTNT